jgi:4a-hydroxytetrahydrobiopterin dehydratase
MPQIKEVQHVTSNINREKMYAMLQEAQKYLGQVPGWELLDNGTKLKRTFHGGDFMSALKLANEVGELCEKEGHHPDITIGWGYCRVVFQTHKINGLHENDFIMAAKVSDLTGRLSMDESHAAASMCRVT